MDSKNNQNKKNSYNKPTNKWTYEEEKKFMFQFLIGRLSTLLTIFLGIKKASTK